MIGPTLSLVHQMCHNSNVVVTSLNFALSTSLFDVLFPIYMSLFVFHVLGESSTYDASLRLLFLVVIVMIAVVSTMVADSR